MTSLADHHRRLERMYDGAALHELVPMRLEVGDGSARVHFTATADFHHAARFLHGSLAFKMLDDAAFFAVASRETEVFTPTVRFEVEFLRPVVEGPLVAVGRVVGPEGRYVRAAAEVCDEEGRVVARGSGTFARGRARWAGAAGYAG